MAHVVKLRPRDLELILAMIYQSMVIKEDSLLKNALSIDQMKQEYLQAAERLCKEEWIECGRKGIHPRDNIFAWIRDNLSWTLARAENRVDPTEDQQIFIEYAQEVIKICEYAARAEYSQGREGRTLVDAL